MGSQSSIGSIRAARGVTLIELLIVLTILGVVLTGGVVASGGLELDRAEAGAGVLARELQHARAEAILRGSPVTVRFGDRRYQAVRSDGTLLRDPLTGRDLDFDLGARSGSHDLWIGAAAFGGTREVTFGADGAPLQGGAVEVRAGGASQLVRVAPVTGRVVVEAR